MNKPAASTAPERFQRPWMIVLLALALMGMALPHRFILGRLFGLPYAFFLVVAAWYLLPRLREVGSDLLRSPMLLAWGGLLAGLAVSIVVNDAGVGLGFQLVRNVGLPAAFLLLGVALGRESSRLVLLLVAAAGFGNLAVGLFTALRAPPVTDFSLMQVSEMYAAGRIYLSPLSGEPENATALNSAALGSVLALLGSLVERRLGLRLAYVAIAVGLVWLGFLTETRGILAVTAVTTMAAFGWVLIRGGRFRTLLTAGLVGGAVAGLLAFVELPERFRIDYWLARGSTGRSEIWSERMMNIPNLLFGVGPAESLMFGFTCHNQYLEMFATFGWIPGAVGLLAAGLTLVGAARLLLNRRTAPADGMVAFGLVAVLGHAFVESHIFSSPQAYYLLFLLVGAVGALGLRLVLPAAQRQARHRRAPLPGAPPMPVPFRPTAS